MSNNTNLSEFTYPSKNRTHFIHIKKSEIIDMDDLTMIKNMLDEKFNDNISISDLKFVKKSDLEKKSFKHIGRYLKSNKVSKCAECKTDIFAGIKFKQLNCGHRFHIECIDNKLKTDIYKKCSCCQTEQISATI
jgi:hypothetical protein